MTAVAAAIGAIVSRDLSRSFRQKSRVVGGLARPFMWLLLVGAGYNAISRVDGASSYQAYVFPGLVVMSALFGGMLTAIATVYDREFGMLRLMLASPAGVPTLLAGRAIAAAIIGVFQGAVVLTFAPLLIPVTVAQVAAAAGTLVLAAVVSSVLGLLVAAPLQSIENFAGILNVVLFAMLFLSGALSPTAGLAILKDSGVNVKDTTTQFTYSGATYKRLNLDQAIRLAKDRSAQSPFRGTPFAAGSRIDSRR